MPRITPRELKLPRTITAPCRPMSRKWSCHEAIGPILLDLGKRVMTAYPYFYAWRNNAKRATLYGRRCRILSRMTKNSVCVEFEDGQREVVSRNAVRKAK